MSNDPVPTSYTTGSYYQDQWQTQWSSEKQEFDSLAETDPAAALAFFIVEMVPTMLQGEGGKVEYQSYQLNCISQGLMPGINNIENDLQQLYGNVGNWNTSDAGQNAFDSANELLQYMYTNPMFTEDAPQLVNTVTNSIESIFDVGTLLDNAGIDNFQFVIVYTDFTVTVNGQPETIKVPQLQCQKQNSNGGWDDDNADAGEVFNGMYSGEWTTNAQGQQLYQNFYNQAIVDCNQSSQAGTDFSNVSTKEMSMYINVIKQILSGDSAMLHQVASVRQYSTQNQKST